MGKPGEQNKNWVAPTIISQIQNISLKFVNQKSDSLSLYNIISLSIYTS